MSILGGTSPMPLVPPIITTFYLGTVPCIFSSPFSNYFVLYSDKEVAVNIFLTIYFRNLGPRGRGCWVRQVDTGDTDDGLPRGFLVGAIVKVWVAHRLNWASELLRRRGEELPRDVGSELRCVEVATSRGLRRVRHAGDKFRCWNQQPLREWASVSHRIGGGRRTGGDGVYRHAGG